MSSAEVANTERASSSPEVLDPEPGMQLERRIASPVVAVEDPTAVLERTARIANALKEFVKQQRLSKKLGHNDYLQVEAWQMVAGFMGIRIGKPVTRPIDGGWEAEVQLTDHIGRVVGGGESMCTRSEEKWEHSDDFQIRSMAATRAIGKAFRNSYGFIAKAAGFEATPYEEMTGGGSEQEAAGPQYGPEYDKQLLGKMTGAAVVQLAGGDEQRGKTLWRQIVGELGYMPAAAALALIKVSAFQLAFREEPVMEFRDPLDEADEMAQDRFVE
jgi:hypothetical protein